MNETDTYVKCEYLADKWRGSVLAYVGENILKAGELMPYDDELFLSNLTLFIDAANFVIKNNLDVIQLEGKSLEFLRYAEECSHKEVQDTKSEIDGLLKKVGM